MLSVAHLIVLSHIIFWFVFCNCFVYCSLLCTVVFLDVSGLSYLYAHS